MTKIKCKMFGVPEIIENENTIYLPSGKVSSILYYILEKKAISRDELVSMFWPESNEKNAKNSLRNVIFKIRSEFESEILLTPNKSLVLLNNRDIDFELDTSKLIENPEENYRIYRGDYLEGVSLSESIQFQYWMDERREFYKGQAAKALRDGIEKAIGDKSTEGVEQDIYKLISMDEFNEDSYVLLLQYYNSLDRHDKVINEYHKLQKLFLNELGISVSEEIKEIYERSLESVTGGSKKDVKQQENLFERQEEATIINHILERFISGENNQHIAVAGEKGIGKTYLTRSILNNLPEDIITFRINCYKVESEIAYSSARTLAYEINNYARENPAVFESGRTDVMKSLADMGQFIGTKLDETYENSWNINLSNMLNAIQITLNELSSRNKILIYIDDINYADDYSLDFYTNLILHLEKNTKFFVTLEHNNSKLDNILNSMKTIDKVKLIELSSYSRDQVREIVGLNVKSKKNLDEITDEIYEISKGNPLFINELINSFNNGNREVLSGKIYDLLVEKFSNYSREDLELLRLISLFYDPVSYDLLLKLSKEDPFKIVNTMNVLINDGVLEEVDDKEIKLRFANSAYREYVYGTLKESTKQILHKTVANILEKELPPDKRSLKSLINIKNQYDLAKDEINGLRFEVYILDSNLSNIHEVFPTLEPFQMPDAFDSKLTSINLMDTFTDLSNRINYLKNYSESVEGLENLSKVEQVYEFCKGRFLIRRGDYKDGIDSINKVLLMAKERENWKLVIDAYKQLIIQGIQIDSPDVMIKNIVPTIRIAKKINNHEELSILYRLFGLYRFMVGELDEAKVLLEKSINILDENLGFKNNYINKAASYNYLGEIMHSKGEFGDAKKYYERAINLCSDTNAISSSVFYLNLGKTNYFSGNYKEMKENFEAAKNYYRVYDIYWKKPVLDTFLALIEFNEGIYENAVEYLKMATADANLINNERDLGMLYLVESVIADEIRSNKIENPVLEKYFNVSEKVYKFNALQYLDPIRDSYEIEFLKDMNRGE